MTKAPADAYDRCKSDAEQVIELLSEHGPEAIVHDGEFTRVFLNYRELALRHIEVGLLAWRRNGRPTSHFHQAYAAFQQLEAFLDRSRTAKEAEQLRDHEHDLFGIVFSLIDRPVKLGSLDGERLNHKFLLYRKYLASLLQGVTVDAALKERAVTHLTGGELIDDCVRTYLMLLGEIDHDLSTEHLVRRAETLWLKRRNDRYFDQFRAEDGYGEFNEIFVDYTLGAILKKIEWRGASAHRLAQPG